MKKTFVWMLATIFFVSLSASSAFAGSKQRHRWQGVAMGVGAAILGSAILNNCRADVYEEASCPERVVMVDRYHSDDACYRGCDHDRRPPRRGGWEVQKIWVAPVVESVWNPGHYDRHNRWVPGRYITIETEPGYWREERVWVGCR